VTRVTLKKVTSKSSRKRTEEEVCSVNQKRVESDVLTHRAIPSSETGKLCPVPNFDGHLIRQEH
jgi:hypothetical protein